MKNLTFLVLILLLSENSINANAKNHKHRKQGKAGPPTASKGRPLVYKNDDNGGDVLDANATPSVTISNTFSVRSYGAKGDGVADDTSAFEKAWADACKVQGSTVLIPSGFVFLVKPMAFSGPNCQSNIVFQLDGKIIAPTNFGAWGKGLLQWLDFSKLKGIAIKGQGVIDGRGSVWWNDKTTTYQTDQEDASDLQGEGEDKAGMPSTKPTALRFYGSTDVTVTGITIQNSPQTHLKFDDCVGVQVSGISISSPANSPNTDGIHLQNSQDVIIHTTNLACGDDCISIQTGCNGIYVHNVNCGPGHGISIGGLGKDGTKACVSNITVRDSTIKNTMNGVRIKTWQGGSGSVQGVMFSNIQVSEVENPILIDQYYCDGHRCANKTSNVAISSVSYQSIKGTYVTNPIRLACSESTPCSGITLSTIILHPSLNAKNDSPFCWEAFGEIQTATTPTVTCLRNGGPSHKQPSNSGGSC
ncbi:polygalacturonase At1g48100-like [Salvia miltiorrhiza]|uniref:polygalacturonase At1g48100-like n=1 Tax=Salvia miltiorrhiza TaxID=226208 RepID=UPI0025AC0306|nr:polygalacturonase At1g48100-like [Salvia miltiorrhiza]